MSSPRPSPKGEGDGISSLSLKETSEERSACTTILKLEQSRGLGGEVEWWEFFPASLSPFGYNETVAQEYFPMTREEVIGTQEDISSSSPKIGEVGRGVQDTQENNTPPLTPPNLGGEWTETFLHWSTFNWSDYEPPFPKVAKIIPAEKLPDDISKIPDDILNWAIECEVTKKPFRIIKQELDFYRKHHLPIPRRHPDQRHLDRMKLRNPRKLYERLCDCAQCETNNKTSTLSSSEGESLPLWKGFSQSENDKGWVHTSREQIPHFELNPKTGTRTKKIITTYSPDRKEIVYCEECYNREVIW
jgi:hypothetical protein